MQLDARVVWTRENDNGSEIGLSFEHNTRATLRGLLELMVDEPYG